MQVVYLTACHIPEALLFIPRFISKAVKCHFIRSSERPRCVQDSEPWYEMEHEGSMCGCRLRPEQLNEEAVAAANGLQRPNELQRPLGAGGSGG